MAQCAPESHRPGAGHQSRDLSLGCAALQPWHSSACQVLLGYEDDSVEFSLLGTTMGMGIVGYYGPEHSKYGSLPAMPMW